jgi:SNF2 family DNA or RNA helicase
MLSASSPRDVQPKLAKIPLKNHQLAMLKRCKDIEASKKGIGIMKDPPGAGKTYVILSLLLQDVGTKNINILVVPQNIYSQWIDAIHKFSDSITYAKYIEYNEVSSLYFNPSFNGINLVLTTPLYFNIIRDALDANKKSVSVNRVIIDEVDSVAFLWQKPLTCKNMWMVSASFDRMKASLMEKFGKDVNEGSVTCQCDSEFVLTGFPLPPPVKKDIMCTSNYLDTILFDMFSAYELQAANACDFSKITLNHITMVATNEQQALEFLMKDLLITIEREEKNIENYDNSVNINEVAHERMLRARAESVKTLEKTKHRLKTISDRLSEGNMCLICYEEFCGQSKVITCCCQNSFCEPCISSWYKQIVMGIPINKCPYCRAINEYENHVLIKVKEEVSDVVPDKVPVPVPIPIQEPTRKMDHLKHLLLNEVGGKVIIFSDFSKVFKEISKMLGELGIKYTELDGGTISNIDRDIYNYRHGDTRVLMCNSNFFGCGMNLEFTTDIIFLHKTNDDMYNQVIGRAQRPGRTGQLNIFRLLHNNES